MEGGRMNEQEQNIAINESRGWKHCDPQKYGSDKVYHLKGKGYEMLDGLPSYTTDLNAIIPIIRELKDLIRYEAILSRVVGDCNTREHTCSIVTARADQHSESYLRYNGKWKEGE
jgi:hypothetical protein